jgi:hypothetical protein
MMAFPTIAITTSAYEHRHPELELPHAIEVAQAEEVKGIPFEDAFIVTYDWDEEKAIEEIKKTFPEVPGLMVAIADCESGLNIDAVGPTNDYGLLQIHEPSWDHVAKRLGLDYKNNPYDNLKMARHVYDNQGITAWVCYTKNYYKKHLR